MRSIFTLIAVALAAQLCFSQVTADYAVRLAAIADTSVPSIKIKWPVYSGALSYSIYKKLKDATSWITITTGIAGTDSSYTDLGVVADSAYEYKVVRNTSSVTAYGYIYAGVHFKAREKRGTLILVVDSTFTDSLASEIHRLMEDLSGDGWAVLRHDVSRNMAVPAVKALLVADYNANPTNVKALFLLGHVPVPYSGDLNPDGHPDHKGAWPADCYYADINGTFTDYSVNDTLASRPQNRNKPGDGKFDQWMIPSPVELMTGRVDFYDMPAFNTSEINMMRRYLSRDHAFRMTDIRVADGGLIDDNFGAFSGEAFAASAWKNFPPLVGDTATHAADFFTVLQSQQHLWAYGCGGGWYQGASGVGSTTDFVNDSVQAIFTMLFGSYFGDWDSQNNFLRAPLASKGLPLTCCWSGRPHWQFHHMAMGEPIGYAAKWAMINNNNNTYFYNYGGRYVHIALMGDPSLRLSYIAPPQQVVANPTLPAEITWNSSTDSVDGYLVYRSGSEFGVYERVSPQLISGNVFYDPNPINGLNYYMVRAVALHEGPSGSYYNISTGIKDTTFVVNTVSMAENASLKISVYPNPSHGTFSVYMSEMISSAAEVEVLDMQGRLVYSEQYNAQGNEAALRVATGITAPGMYLLKLHTAKGTAVTRINLLP